MIKPAPRSRAPTVAHSPIGPWANTATWSPVRTFPLSAPEIPVEAMSGSMQDLLVAQLVGDHGQICPGIRHQEVLGPGAVDSVAEPPATEWAVTLRNARRRQ